MLYNVLQYLEKTEKRLSDKTAFTDGETGLTFRELGESARAIGSGLAEEISVRKPVIVLMEKTADCIAAFLGAVYAGCFYVPLDSKMPVDRMQLIIDTLQPAALIASFKAPFRIFAHKEQGLVSFRLLKIISAISVFTIVYGTESSLHISVILPKSRLSNPKSTVTA